MKNERTEDRNQGCPKMRLESSAVALKRISEHVIFNLICQMRLVYVSKANAVLAEAKAKCTDLFSPLFSSPCLF